MRVKIAARKPRDGNPVAGSVLCLWLTEKDHTGACVLKCPGPTVKSYGLV